MHIAPYKIGAFALSAALATTAGLFYGMLYGATPGPDQFGILQSFFLLALPGFLVFVAAIFLMSKVLWLGFLLIALAMLGLLAAGITVGVTSYRRYRIEWQKREKPARVSKQPKRRCKRPCKPGRRSRGPKKPGASSP